MKERIVILGAGESGVGAAVLAKKKGFIPFVSDNGSIREPYKSVLVKHGILWEEGKHSADLILDAVEVIKSPGIPEDSKVVKAIIAKGIPMVSEIEFAYRYTKAKKICITGSNGKTTTSCMIYHMLKKAGMKTVLAGNVGKSFALQVAEGDYDYYVIELSSFQLDGMVDFRADIAILMNITPDHLDRYGYDMKRYIESKFRITRNQSVDDYFIYCFDDEIIKANMNRVKGNAKTLSFSLDTFDNQAAYVKQEIVNFHINKDHFTMSIHDLALKGKHNAYNSMAAGIAGQLLNIRKEMIRASLSDFQGVEHRLEPVIKVHGIQFINDSKATNVNSSWYALESMTDNVIWIAGGIDKGNDYNILKDLVTRKVKAIICLGKDNSKLHKAFAECTESIVDTNSMAEAVRTAYYLGKKGDTVLLSPACASFDLFENYEDRGRQFKQAVRAL
ncbi:MAG: UDP-N-acetylmuramoyl-L-alanine--D-glutamate ligase [Bacteroidales bacterium]|nr:MAG: UDP-N-acetylmuramoyl-L-alanine--D-glutamate ligase [Bacteroidales bacterium]